MRKGKFIVVEGMEGAGKSSTIHCLATVLEQAGIPHVCTREPGGTALAERLRECIKQDWGQETVTPQTELLLMYAARSQLFENVIAPSLQQGIWVIGDRHDLSTQAYQGGGRQLAQQWLASLREMTLGNFRPDLTLLLDVTPSVGLARARGRGELDRIEKEDMAFFERVRAQYLSLASQDDSILIIDGQQSMVTVQQAVTEAVKGIL